MALSRNRPDLEKHIPNHLKHLPRVCSRQECRSRNVELRYFNNKEKVGYVQPRLFCNDCKKLFTLGGTLRNGNKKHYRNTKKIRRDEKTRNLQIQDVEIGESSRPRRLDLARKHSSKESNRHALSLETKETPSNINLQEETQVTQETNMIKESLELFNSNELDEANFSSEKANCNSEEDDYGLEEAISNGDRRAHSPSVQNTFIDIGEEKDDQSIRQFKRPRDQREEEGFDNNEGLFIQMDLLKNEIKLHLLNAQVIFYEFQVKKGINTIGHSCKRTVGESKRLKTMPRGWKATLNEGIEGLLKILTKTVGSLVNDSEYDQLVANGATMEDVFPVIESMLVEVEEMDLEHISHSAMLATLERARQLGDEVKKLVI